MKSLKRVTIFILILLTVAALVLSACGPLDDSGKGNNNKNQEKNKGDDDQDNKDNSANPDKITICHKTGSANNPYAEIAVSKDAAMDGHASHAGDIIPAPANGCPAE